MMCRCRIHSGHAASKGPSFIRFSARGSIRLPRALRNQYGYCIVAYDFNRMVVEFTMIAQDRVNPCAISTAAMDDLEDGRSLKPEQRVDQFMRLREVIERQASRKFSDVQAASDRPLILRSNDFPP
jgi:hypothetical protein